jgi:hypothetical protein
VRLLSIVLPSSPKVPFERSNRVGGRQRFRFDAKEGDIGRIGQAPDFVVVQLCFRDRTQDAFLKRISKRDGLSSRSRQRICGPVRGKQHAGLDFRQNRSPQRLPEVANT